MANSDDDETILICEPTASGGGSVYGSIRATCSKCSCPIWVSPSGQKVANAKLLCGNCARPILEAEKDVKLGLAPGSIEEMIDHFRKVRNN